MPPPRSLPLCPPPTKNCLQKRCRQSCLKKSGIGFPVGRVGLEMVPTHGGAFGLRLGWHRPKNIVPVFETTPLRPLGDVTLGGQTFPLFFTQHGKQKRGRIRLAGKRKTAKTGPVRPALHSHRFRARRQTDMGVAHCGKPCGDGAALPRRCPP